MARRRRKGKAGKRVAGLLSALLAVPALYLAAALGGSLIPVNRGWTEPAEGTTIYLADNGIHADIIMPVKARRARLVPVAPQERMRRATSSGLPSALASSAFISTRQRGWTSLRARSGRRWPAASVSFTSNMSPAPTTPCARSGFGQRNIAACGHRSGRSSRTGGRSVFLTKATTAATPSIAASARRARSTPATAGSRTDSGWRGSRPASGHLHPRARLALPEGRFRVRNG